MDDKMDDTTTNAIDKLSDVELGVIIAAAFVVIMIIIILINVCIYKHRSKRRRPSKNGDEDRMLNMQTDRTVNGQKMKQVIVKSQPNGNMDKYNQNSMPYQTMDPETNTVRYETEPEAVMITFQGSDEVIITSDDVDSGTGASPVRNASVDVHGEVELEQAHTNAAFNNDDEDIAPYGYSAPPPPESSPPPLTPGLQVTDLDAESDDGSIPPPPPPVLVEPVYSQINRDRGDSVNQGSAVMRNASLNKSIWRPSSEIEIIEKEKF